MSLLTWWIIFSVFVSVVVMVGMVYGVVSEQATAMPLVSNGVELPSMEYI